MKVLHAMRSAKPTIKQKVLEEITLKSFLNKKDWLYYFIHHPKLLAKNSYFDSILAIINNIFSLKSFGWNCDINAKTNIGSQQKTSFC